MLLVHRQRRAVLAHSRYTTFCAGGSMNCCVARQFFHPRRRKQLGFLQFERGLFGRQPVRLLPQRSGSGSRPADRRRSAAARRSAAPRPHTTEPISFQHVPRACGSACAHDAAVVDPLDEKIDVFVGEGAHALRSPPPRCSPPRPFAACSNASRNEALYSTVARVAILPDLLPSPYSESRPLQKRRALHKISSARSFGAARRRIVPDFFFRRPHDVPGENIRSPALRQRLKTLLDLAVLERHEGERPPRVRPASPAWGSLQQRVQFFVLVDSPRSAAP